MKNEFSCNLMASIIKLERFNPLLLENPGFVSIIEELSDFLNNLEGEEKSPVISVNDGFLGFDFNTANHRNFYFKCMVDVDGSLMYDFSEYFKKDNDYGYIKYNQGKISLLEDGSINYRRINAHVDEYYSNRLSGVSIVKNYDSNGVVNSFEQRDVNVYSPLSDDYLDAKRMRKKLYDNNFFGFDGLCMYPFYWIFNAFDKRILNWDRKIVATRTDLNKAHVDVFGYTNLGTSSVGDNDFSMEVPLNLENGSADMVLPNELDLNNFYKMTNPPSYLEYTLKEPNSVVRLEQTRDISYEIPDLTDKEKEELIARESNLKVQEGLRTFTTGTKGFGH